MPELRNPTAPDANATIWRYMNDWKFDALLSTFNEQSLWEPAEPGERTTYYNEPGQLWFSLPRAFGDDKEGTFPVINEDPELYCDRMAEELGLTDNEARTRKALFVGSDAELVRDSVRTMAQLCGVSCWHENSHESWKMWAEYVGQAAGVAIKTTVGRLEESLSFAHASPAKTSRPVLSSVGYVNLETFFLSEDGFYNLLCLKGTGFRHENEVRVIAKSPWFCKVSLSVRRPFPPNVGEWDEFVRQMRQEEKQKAVETAVDDCRKVLATINCQNAVGFNLPVRLSAIIAEVVTRPGSSNEYAESVRDRLANVGLNDVSIHTSELI